MGNPTVFLFFLPLFLLTNNLSAQSVRDTVEYFDANWQPANENSAAFYREISYDEAGKPVGVVRDYYISGVLYFEGRLSSVRPDTLDQLCTWYYKSSKPRAQGFYGNGRLLHFLKEWDINGIEQGKLNDQSFFFSNDFFAQKVKIWERKSNQKLGSNIFSVNLLIQKGDSFKKEGLYDKTEELYQIAHDFCKYAGEQSESYVTLLYSLLGILYLELGENTEALFYFNKALKKSMELEDDILVSQIYSNLGWTHIRMNEPDSAINYLREALKALDNAMIKGEKNTSYGRSFIYDNFGQAYIIQREYDKAKEYFQKALKIRERTDNKLELTRSYLNLGVLYHLQGLYTIAQTHYFMSISILKDLPINAETLRCYLSLGSLYDKIGLHSKGIEYFKKAVEIAEQLYLPLEIASLNNNISMAYNNQNQFDKAIFHNQISLDILKNLDAQNDLAYSYNNLGTIYAKQKRRGEALKNYFMALEIQEKMDNAPMKGATLGNIGELYQTLDSFELAEQYYLRGIKICEGLELKKELADLSQNLGNLYLQKKDYKNALNWVNKAKDIYSDLNIKISYSHILNRLGLINEQLEKWDLAKKHFHEALSIQTQLEVSPDIMDTYEILCLHYHFRNNSDSTFFYAQRFIQLNEKNRNQNVSPSSRLLIIQEGLSVSDVGISAAYKLGEYEIAFAWAERSTARTFLDRISEGQLNDIRFPSHINDSLTVLEYQINAIHKALNDEYSDAKRKILINRRDSLQSILNEYYVRLRLVIPQYSSYTSSIKLEQAQKILSDDEILLKYHVGWENTYVFVITNHSIDMLDIGPSSDINILLDNFQNQYINKYRTILQKGGSDVVTKRKVQNNFFKISNALYRKLWYPIESLVPDDKKIILAVNQQLHYLPFGLLIQDDVPKEYQDYKYLIKKYSISYCPSASVLHYERTERTPVPVPQNTFLGIAINEFSKNQCADSLVVTEDLKNSVFETTAISHFFPKHSTKLLLKEDATEYNVKSTDLSSYKYIHFSSHALIDTRYSAYSSILLHPSDSQDGCFRVNELTGYNLKADLITLSACKTALGSLQAGNGIEGFATALMSSGAVSVVLSLWDIADTSSKELFTNFYAELSQNGSDKFTPLQKSQLQMIAQGGEYANPFYWAPFIFIGERNSRY